MRSSYKKLFYSVSCLSLAIMTMSKVEAANIGNGTTVTAPSTPNQAMNFTAPAPGGTFVIETGATFVGALTTDGGAAIGTLVLNSGSTYDGAVGDPSILQITLNGNATIVGATGAQNFSLGQYTLTNTGALNLPANPVLNTKVVSNALFGNVGIGAATDSIAGPSITINVDASGVVALTPGAPLFIVSAGAGTSGLPVTVTSNNVLYSFIGTNLNGNISIIPTLNPAIPTPPGVGTVLTPLLAMAAAHPGSDIATVIAALTALPTPAAIAKALMQFNPNVNGAIPLMSFNAMKQFTNVWSKQMGYGRCVYATDCETDCCYREVRRKPQQTQCCNPGCSTEINCENVCNTFEVWGDVFGYFGHQNRRDGFRGYNSQIYGGMVGFQAPLNQLSSVGLGGGYANTQIHERNKGSIQTYDLTAYYSYDATNFYADAAFSFDVNRYKNSRKIEFPGIDRRADAHYYGQEYSGLVDAGYRYYTNWCGVITPFASLLYSYLHVNGYHEHGAKDLDLHVRHQHYNFLESSLGLKLSQIIQTRHGVFVPEIHGIWLHDFFRDRMNLKTKFSGVAGGTGFFETEGPSQDRNWGDVGAGITFISCSNLAFELVYNYEFGRTYHSQEGLLKITQRF